MLGALAPGDGPHESSSISKKDLRQVQDRAPQGRSARDLRKRETQTETRVMGLNWVSNCPITNLLNYPIAGETKKPALED
jgi:hypothetical protein